MDTRKDRHTSPRVLMQIKPETHQKAKELSRALTEKNRAFCTYEHCHIAGARQTAGGTGAQATEDQGTGGQIVDKKKPESTSGFSLTWRWAKQRQQNNGIH